MKNEISFSQAVEGYLLAANARRLIPHIIEDYVNTFRKFDNFLQEDPPISSIKSKQVESFLTIQTVSKKTLLNYHTGPSALWTWAVNEELVEEHIVQKVERAKPEKRSIKPYSEEDVRAMLAALTHSRLYTRPGKRDCANSVPNTERNRAIILLLLDTGIRSSELCDLRIHQVDVRNRRITVMGKGTKERTIPFSAPTGQAIWRYLAQRKDDTIDERLFTSKNGRSMNRDQLLKTLKRIGRRAGIQVVTVHRFRHTFAINYLRNGGDPYSLQVMLGHSTMEMVKTYLALSQADLEKNHRQASPVANWKL
jgi:integrase/recombinase XerD